MKKIITLQRLDGKKEIVVDVSKCKNPLVELYKQAGKEWSVTTPKKIMAARQQWLKDAIKGGWGKHIGRKWRISASHIEHMKTYCGNRQWDTVMPITHALLDPLAWQAVGKTRGWNRSLSLSYDGYCLDDECNTDYKVDDAYRIDEWLYKQHLFIDHLAEGFTIEEALSKLV